MAPLWVILEQKSSATPFGLLAMPQVPRKMEDPMPGASLTFPEQCPRKERSEGKKFPVDPLPTLGCFSIVDISAETFQKETHVTSPGLTHCWEWISTGAFDFRKTRPWKCHKETPCIILNEEKCHFFILLNQRTGGQNRSCLVVWGEEVGPSGRGRMCGKDVGG
jgi:hypothetical protein